jgi:hypothetical protein
MSGRRGAQWHAGEMSACRTNRERLCLEKPILDAGFANIQKAHHFQQKNRRELAC